MQYNWMSGQRDAPAFATAMTPAMANAYQTSVKPMDVLAKVAMRTNAEMASLMSQRAQAYMAFPSRLAAARTPYDLMTEQMRFWQTAMNQYVAASRQVAAAISSLQDTAPVRQEPASATTGLPLMDAWLRMMTMPFLPAGQDQASADAQNRRGAERDFITFSEPKPASPVFPAQDAAPRRAA